MKTPKRQIGDLGEDIACKYLKRRGFRILGRNYLRKWGEIDIVAEKGSSISFIEVKTVSREPFRGESLPAGRQGSRVTSSQKTEFRPEDNVHPEKLKRLHRAIQTYLLDSKVPESKEWRIDVVCVYLDIAAKKAKVDLIENVTI